MITQAAKLQLAEYHIGTLILSDEPVATESAIAEPSAVFLDKTKWKTGVLVEIEMLNHDSRNYKFALEHSEQLLGLPTGQHVYCRLRRKASAGDAEAGGESIEGELVQRAYTPVSTEHAKGFLDLLIKVRSLSHFRTLVQP